MKSVEEPDVDGLIGVDAGNAKCMDLDGEKETVSAWQPNQAALEIQTELASSKTGAKAQRRELSRLEKGRKPCY